jgi:hypothetical protein
MAGWRILGSVVVTLIGIGLANAQTYELAEAPKVGDCLKIDLAMKLTGEMQITREGKSLPLKIEASAAHAFPERILAVGSNGKVEKTARLYEVAHASITTGNDHSERSLRPERRLIVAQQLRGQELVYCPAGSLTRQELELTSEHFDTLSLTGLLPAKAVKIDEAWKVTNEVAQALCGFEGLTSQELTCKLEEVKEKTARVSVAGPAAGIDRGALVELTIEATYQFDLDAKCLTSLTWKQKDKRGQGPANPATTVETTTNLKRLRIDRPATLTDVALISVPDGLEPPGAMMLLSYHHEGKPSFDLAHSREWHLVGQTRDRAVFRLMDRGDFVAQVTITPWESAKEGEHMSPQTFREAMAKTPGWEQGDVVQEGEIPAEKGRWIYRISAPGLMDGIKVVQNFVLIAGPGGEQVVMAFTMTPAQAEKIGTRDLALINGLTNLSAKPKE